MHLRKLFIGVAVLGAACKDEPSGPAPLEPARIAISAPVSVIVVGSTVQLSATVYDQNNKAVTGAPVSWQSLTPDIASVTSGGLVSGIAVGEATIRATSGAFSDNVILTVDPDPCVTPISLAPGQIRVLSGPAAVACITLAPIGAASDLLFVTANVAQAQDNLGLYQVAVPDEFTARQGLRVPRMADAALLLEQQAVEWADHVESNLRARERDLLRVAKPAVRARERQTRGAETAIAAAALEEGDMVTFRVPDVHSSNLCTTYRDVQAVVKRLGQRALIAQDVAAPAGGFSDADFAAVALEFDNLIYRTDTTFFGRETDRNNDGRITILYTPEVNKATPQGSAGFVAGFFWGGDLVKKTEYQAAGVNCPQTNEQEIFYLIVPDPQGTINSNPRSVETVRQNTRGTIAHELQHMINQGVRLFDPAVDSSETAWLNEALSHMAEELVGRALRGYGDFQDLAFSDVNPNPSQQDDYNAFFRQNLARHRSWMQRPDTASPTSAKARNQLAPRGAGWMFLRYVTDHFSNNNAKGFLRALVKGPDIGTRNLLQHASTAQFDELVRGFLVSQYVDDLGIPGLDTRLTMRSWQVRSVMSGVSNNQFPLLVNDLPGNVSTQSLSGSGNYFRLTSPLPLPETTFRMTAPNGGPVSFAGAQVYVVRLN